MSDWWN
jgi:hypothetical protein